MDPRLTLYCEQVVGVRPIRLCNGLVVSAATWCGGGGRKKGAAGQSACKAPDEGRAEQRGAGPRAPTTPIKTNDEGKSAALACGRPVCSFFFDQYPFLLSSSCGCQSTILLFLSIISLQHPSLFLV